MTASDIHEGNTRSNRITVCHHAMNQSSSPQPPEENRDESYADEQLDWYSPGRTKNRNQSPENTNAEKTPGHFQSMIQKPNIGTSLAALFLFFLPWIDIQCSGNSFATQSGIQTIYGGGSVTDEMKAFGEENGQIKSNKAEQDESMGYPPLVALAFLAVAGAVVVSFKALRSGDEPQTNLAGILCATALGLITAHKMIGFPVKKNLGKSLAEASKTETSDNPMHGLGKGMAEAMMLQIQVRHRPALYIELILLGLPTLVVANGLIDKLIRVDRNRSEGRQANKGKDQADRGGSEIAREAGVKEQRQGSNPPLDRKIFRPNGATHPSPGHRPGSGGHEGS